MSQRNLLFLDNEYQIQIKVMKTTNKAINFRSVISNRYFWLPKKALFTNMYSYKLKNWFNANSQQSKIFEQDKRIRTDLVTEEKNNSLDFEPSEYQKKILDHVINRKGNVLVNATAGSGKTTTIEYLVSKLDKQLNILIVAFNTDIVSELQSRLDSSIEIRTLHSLGRKLIVNNNLDNVEVETNKIFQYLINSHLDVSPKDKSDNAKKLRKEFYSVAIPTSKLVGLVQSFGIRNPDKESLENLMIENDINVKDDIFPIVINWTKDTVRYTREKTNVISLNDMIDLPFYHGYKTREVYDYILIDECQDLNMAQMEIIFNIMSPQTNVIFVGDNNQAIYGWRGASNESIQQIKNLFDCIEFDLPISYRHNNLYIVEYINDALPYIKHIAKDNAKYGKELEHIDYDKLYSLVTTNDMVISRTNSAMIKPVWNLIKAGIKAVILGKEIGEDLISLIQSKAKDTVIDTITSLITYKENKVKKLESIGKQNTADMITDKVNAAVMILEEHESLDNAYDFIRNTFSDDTEGIVFSTIHKAKGLQSNTVFILESDKLPINDNNDSLDQELNCTFVALSRAKNMIYFVND